MLRIPSQIVKVETTSDKGLKLVVHTNELKSEDKAEVMNLHEKTGYFVFAEQDQEIKESDIPDEPIEFEGQKTLSQRLRNTLFVLHEKQGGKPEDFEDYRRKVMERLIAHYKSKLDE